MVLIFLLVSCIMYLLILVLCLTLSVLEKLKNLIFEILIIPQSLKIHNQRSTSAQSISFKIKAFEFFKGYVNAGKGSGEQKLCGLVATQGPTMFEAEGKNFDFWNVQISGKFIPEYVVCSTHQWKHDWYQIILLKLERTDLLSFAISQNQINITNTC